MLDKRRRRLACLFALVLLMELAVLCCACAHVSSHVCHGPGRCAVCDILKSERRYALAFLLMPLCLAQAGFSISRFFQRGRLSIGTPVSLRVRLND